MSDKTNTPTSQDPAPSAAQESGAQGISGSTPVAATKPTSGVVEGVNMLLGIEIGGEFKPLGYSKTCSIQNKADTKDRAHKNVASSGKWGSKTINKLSVSISTEGFCSYDDPSSGFVSHTELLKLWETGAPVAVRYCHRGEETALYRAGSFVITQYDETAPADDDATYSLSLENNGEVKSHSLPTQG